MSASGGGVGGDAQFSAKDAKIDLGAVGGAPVVESGCVGLTKAEVMKFAQDPFWVALRRVLFTLFWLLWIAMLVGAIFIIVITPKCAKQKEPEWYESSAIYTIRVDKFADSNGDKTGDLRGIIDKLGYLRDTISMRAIALEGLLDKNDFNSIRPGLGSTDDFTKLAGQIKVLVKIPLGLVGDGASQEVDALMGRWRSLGAAGLWLEEFDPSGGVFEPSDVARWRSVLSSNATTSSSITNDDPVLLALSANKFDHLPNSFCKQSHTMCVNYEMMRLSASFDSTELSSLLDELVMDHSASATASHNNNNNATVALTAPPDAPSRANFVVATGGVTPLFERFQPRSRAEALLMFNMLSDATPFVYQGDEYAKKDSSGEPKSRDLQPLVEPDTGFMDWLDVDRIQTQPEHNLFKLFQKLASLRLTEASVRMGSTAVRQLNSASQLAMARIKAGNPGLVVVSNFRAEPASVNLVKYLSNQIPAQGSVVLTSTNSRRVKDEVLPLDALPMAAEETLVLQFVPQSADTGGH